MYFWDANVGRRVDASRGGVRGVRQFWILHLGCIQWRERWAAWDGRPRITDTSARTATASLVERRGEGVDRRAAHQDSRRSRNDGSSPSANRGGGRDGERLTSSRVARSTADTTCCGSPRSRRRRGGAAARGRDGEAGRARCRRDRHACRDPGFAEEGSCGCGRVRRLPGRRASPLVRGRDVARQVTLGAGSAAPNTSGEASSLESVSRGVCAGAAVRREQARDLSLIHI